jgi:hypothetical protein
MLTLTVGPKDPMLSRFFSLAALNRSWRCLSNCGAGFAAGRRGVSAGLFIEWKDSWIGKQEKKYL